MEMLSVLEKKIQDLIIVVKNLQEENQVLCNQKSALEAQVASLGEQVFRLEESLLKETESFQVLCQENSSAQQVVDELIANIDSLIQDGKQ